MFTKHPSILVINSDTVDLYFAKDVLKSKPSVSLPWKKETLLKTVNSVLQKKDSSLLRLLFDDDFVYMVPVTLPPKTPVTEARSIVYETLTSTVPEEIENCWDVLFTHTEKGDTVGLACVPVYRVFSEVAEALQKNGIQLDGVLPVSEAVKIDPNPVAGISVSKSMYDLPLTIHTKKQEAQQETAELSKDTTSPEPVQFEKASSMNHDNSRNERLVIRKSLRILLITSIFFAAIVNISILTYRGYQQQLAREQTTVPLPTRVPTPTTNPVPQLSKLSFEVLNGTPVAGEAARVAELLEETGVKKVTTGNAERSTYKVYEIQTKENLDTELIGQMLEDILKIDSFQTGESLLASEEADVKIIVGSD